MIKLLLKAVALVLIIAVISNVFGVQMVEVIVGHFTDALQEVASIAEKLGQDANTSLWVNNLKSWLMQAGGHL